MIARNSVFESEEYPFNSHYINIDGHNMHYLDEGSGPVIIMLHGNPTWSFYYRNLVKTLRQQYRVIVPDHMGCGLSDKPQKYNYLLQNHIKNIQYLIKELKIQTFSLVMHDWGGTIGMGVAVNQPENIDKIIILNSAAFTDSDIPKRINLLRTPFIGEVLIRLFNIFVKSATFMATQKGLKPEALRGLTFPYNNFSNRVAINGFVQDIPMTTKDTSFALLKKIENSLYKLKDKKILILWGAKDFCFNNHFFQRWKKFFPEAKTHLYENAGHYILEDEKDSVTSFVKNHFDFHN